MSLKLNIGCGPTRFEGFVNIDMDAALNPDIVCDVSNLDHLYSDNSVDEIVAYDVIEHFDRFQYMKALENWYSKLKPGGSLLLRTNDWDKLMHHYLQGKLLPSRRLVDFDKLVWHFMCEHEKPGMGHKWGFNRETIARALLDTGFKMSSISFFTDADLSIGNYPYASCPDFSNLVVRAVK